MYIECTAACNISCTEACCAPETGITRTRQAGMLDFELFRRVIDEAGPSLQRIDFFNYGEAFLHKRAVEMCEYIKTQLSAHLPLHEHQRAGAHRGAGAPAGALGHRRGDVLDRRRDARRATCKYRQRGRFDVAIAHAAGDGRREAPRRAATLPFLNWRYILFNWNDSDEEMDRGAAAGGRDRRRSAVLGDHRPSRGQLLAPVRARHAGLSGDPPRNLGRQRPRQRHSRRDAAGAHRRPHARAAACR